LYCVINGGLVILSIEETQLALVLKEHSCKIRRCCCHRPLELPHLTHGVEGCPGAGGRHTVVLRPSEMTPLSTLLFAELFVHLPPDVINIVSGYGKDCGGPLVLNPWVCMIAAILAIAADDVYHVGRKMDKKFGKEQARWRWGSVSRNWSRPGRVPRDQTCPLGLRGWCQAVVVPIWEEVTV